MAEKMKLAAMALAVAYGAYYGLNSGPGDWHFIDNVNLVIHEAGHVVFMPFGHAVQALGGSLLQLAVPAAFLGYFWRSGQGFSAAVMLIWLATNFFSVGAYAADAMALRLELLGGEGSIHDWNYLLLHWGVLRQAAGIGAAFRFLGVVSVFSAAWFGYAAYRRAMDFSVRQDYH